LDHVENAHILQSAFRFVFYAKLIFFRYWNWRGFEIEGKWKAIKMHLKEKKRNIFNPRFKPFSAKEKYWSSTSDWWSGAYLKGLTFLLRISNIYWLCEWLKSCYWVVFIKMLLYICRISM
jgi:hypothetical protein